MNEEGTFWIKIWRLVAAAICVLIVSISSCTIHGNHRAASLLEKGVPANTVRCVIDTGSTRSTPCALSHSEPNGLN